VTAASPVFVGSSDSSAGDLSNDSSTEGEPSSGETNDSPVSVYACVVDSTVNRTEPGDSDATEGEGGGHSGMDESISHSIEIIQYTLATNQIRQQ
jgi:hypothetical protein